MAAWWAPAALYVTVFGATADSIDLQGVPVELSADDIRVSVPPQRFVIAGHASLRHGELSLEADRIAGEVTSAEEGHAVAEGNVLITGPKGAVAEATRLEYDFGRQRGELRDVVLRMPLPSRRSLGDLMRPSERPRFVLVTAATATRSPGRYELRSARLTTSTATPPQFEVRAGELTLRTTKPAGGEIERLSGRDLEVRLYNRPIMGLSEASVSPGQLLFPNVGVNSTEGVFIERSFTFGLQPLRLELTPRLGTDAPVTGRGRLFWRTPFGTFEAIGSHRERRLLLLEAQPVRYSRIPEFGWKYGPWELPALGGRLDTRLTYGLYDEENNRTLWRRAVDLSYRRDLYDGETTHLGGSAGAHYALYDGRRRYGWVSGSVYAGKRFGYRVYVDVGLTSHYIVGTSPFRFDQIEIATQLQTLAKVRITPHWLAKADYLIDVTSRAVRSSIYGLAYRDRLLEYGFTVRTLPEFEFGLDAQILGF